MSDGECGPNSHTWLRYGRGLKPAKHRGRFCVTCDRDERDDGRIRPGYRGGPPDPEGELK